MAKELLRWGADVAIKDREGCTALYRAAEGSAHYCQREAVGHITVMRLLMEKGADLLAENHKGGTVGNWAKWDRVLTNFLAESGYHNLNDKKSRWILMMKPILGRARSN